MVWSRGASASVLARHWAALKSPTEVPPSTEAGYKREAASSVRAYPWPHPRRSARRGLERAIHLQFTTLRQATPQDKGETNRNRRRKKMKSNDWKMGDGQGVPCSAFHQSGRGADAKTRRGAVRSGGEGYKQTFHREALRTRLQRTAELSVPRYHDDALPSHHPSSVDQRLGSMQRTADAADGKGV